jgi:hypothetical protein
MIAAGEDMYLFLIYLQLRTETRGKINTMQEPQKWVKTFSFLRNGVLCAGAVWDANSV